MSLFKQAIEEGKFPTRQALAVGDLMDADGGEPALSSEKGTAWVLNFLKEKAESKDVVSGAYVTQVRLLHEFCELVAAQERADMPFDEEEAARFWLPIMKAAGKYHCAHSLADKALAKLERSGYTRAAEQLLFTHNLSKFEAEVAAYCEENVHNVPSDWVNERLVDMTKEAVGGFSAMLPATADRHALSLQFYHHAREVCCTEAWHSEAVAKYVEATVRPALRLREERDAKVAPLVTAVRRGDYETATAPKEPTAQEERFLRLHTTWLRHEAEATRVKAHMHQVYAKYAAKDGQEAVVREAIERALETLRLAVQARNALEQDGACGFVAATTNTHAAEETSATDLGVSTASLLQELTAASTAAATGRFLFVRALSKSETLPSPIKRRAVSMARDLQPSGGVALERGRRASRYPHESAALPFATGQPQAWDASLVGMGVAYCSDHAAPAGSEWTCGTIGKALGSQKFELRLATKKQTIVLTLPVSRVRYLPVKDSATAPAAAPPPLPARPAATALQMLQSTSAGGAAEGVVAKCLRPLSAEEDAKVQASWEEPHDFSEVLCPGHNHKVTRKDLAAVRPCTDSKLGREHWLNDAVINPLILLLRAALGAQSSVLIFTSAVGPLLLRSDYRIAKPKLERELRAYSRLFAGRTQWLVPMFKRKHWFVVQVDFELKQIVAYDPLPMAGRKEDCAAALRAVHRFVADLHLQEEKQAFDWTGWGQAHVRVTTHPSTLALVDSSSPPPPPLCNSTAPALDAFSLAACSAASAMRGESTRVTPPSSRPASHPASVLPEPADSTTKTSRPLTAAAAARSWKSRGGRPGTSSCHNRSAHGE